MERFWSKVDVRSVDECWLWQACVLSTGYGQFGFDGARVGAHRMAYELSVGPIPDGLVIDHLCRNRACVNPAHLEAVSVKENTLRGTGPTATNAMKAECLRGHMNWLVRPNGTRSCRACKTDQQRIARRR